MKTQVLGKSVESDGRASAARDSSTPSQSGAGAEAPALRRRGRPRRDQVDQLNRELLQQALDHFLEKGFEATTMYAIARSVGMSKQTVYARYADKLALFKAALQDATDEWLAPLQRLPELETDDLEETLIRVSRAIVATLMGPAGVRLIRITNAESYRLPEISEYTYQRGHQILAGHLADLFRRKMRFDASAPPDFDDLATAFLNLMSSPARLTAWGMGGDQTDVEEFVRRRVKLFLHGVLPAETARNRLTP
jgi:TetR/AcrR family transcriptional repressor of mexJK operon